MVSGMKRQKQHSFKTRLYGIFGGILCCTFFVVACGGTPLPPKHPLSANDTPVDQASANATVTSSAQILPIKVVSSGTNVYSYPGGQVNLSITTSPYAICSFLVSYGRSTPSKSAGIIPHTANAQGMVSWTWRVDNDAHTGSWPLTLTAVLPSGQKTSTSVNVTVTLPPLTIVNSQSVLRAYPKGTMSLSISTAPNLICVLTLNYGPGRTVKSLRSTSNSQGFANWTWHVDSSAVAGAWPLTIVATLADGEQTSTQVQMTVL